MKDKILTDIMKTLISTYQKAKPIEKPLIDEIAKDIFKNYRKGDYKDYLTKLYNEKKNI